MSSPLLLAVDGDSLLHRAHYAWAGSNEEDSNGRPVWALRGLIGFIAAAAARFTPDALVVGFDCREHSVRRAAFADYKAQRPEKPPQLQIQLHDAPDVLRAAGLRVVTERGYEADDVLASAAAAARRNGWRAILMTSDRDSFALIDETTSVLRVVNGGIDDSPLLTPRALEAVCRVVPGQYRDFASLRGDPSDNLPGLAGVGGKTAAKLLSAFPGLDAVYEAIAAGDGQKVSAVVGETIAVRLASEAGRADVARNRSLMTMREDLALPELIDLRLPLDAEQLTAAFAARDIRLSRSVWALVGGQRPDWSTSVSAPALSSSSRPASALRLVTRHRRRRPHPVSEDQLLLF